MARNNGKFRAFSQGIDLRGPLALSVTQREGGARLPRRPRPAHSGDPKRLDDFEQSPALDSAAVSHLTEAEQPAPAEDEIMQRTLGLLALLRDAEEVRAPAGVPCEGKVVSFDNAFSFMLRYHSFLRELGPELASPQITFHWTAEENFKSIVESNLRVPDPETGIKKKHGSAFGRGIYTCPDYKMAKEDFSYGSSATFACLVLTGRQLTRQHGSSRHGLSECKGLDFDSVVGRLPGRNCVTWVLPESEQVLPCFLVDEVAIPAAVSKLRAAMSLINQPWPDGSQKVESCFGDANLSIPVERSFSSSQRASENFDSSCATGSVNARWRRHVERGGHDSGSGGQGAGENCETEGNDAFATSLVDGIASLPYGGDLQAAMRAQDRPALKLLLAARDTASKNSNPGSLSQESEASCLHAPQSTGASNGGRRWGSKRAQHSHLQLPEQVSQKAAAAKGLFERGGDLLEASEDFIVHQCNCVFSGGAQGVAEAIFRNFPGADVYGERASKGRSQDVPGTVSVHGRIVNLYGQLLPGRPADDAPPGGWPGSGRFVSVAQASGDTRAARFRWFESCLLALDRVLPGDGSRSLAFPARIGCGLAGGNWSKYLAALRRFSAAHPDWHIVIYDNEQPHGDTIELQTGCSNAKVVQGSKHDGECGFWKLATLEVLRGGSWEAYHEEHQASLKAALQRKDDCSEVLVDAERRAALTALAENGVFPQSLGALPGGETDGEGNSAGLNVRLPWNGESLEVSLAAIASCAGLGEERQTCQGGLCAAVRLRLPPVKEGELRLPSDLDASCAAPTPRECGRLVCGKAELEALGGAVGNCGICLDEIHSKKCGGSAIQLACAHVFHESCISRWFEEYRRCPTCKRRFGHIVGNQPCVGTMSWKLDSSVRLAGYSDSFTIVLNFRFPPGRDAQGQHYRGRSQQAYLPHDERGKLLLTLFQLAFRRRVMFDVRISATDNKYWPAFNIHLKTAISGGPERFGFPDEGYFQRVMEELRQNGVTVAELT